MADFQGPNMSHDWLNEMGAKLDEMQKGKPMDIEKIVFDDGFTIYRVWSNYAKDSITFEPDDLLKLSGVLQELERSIEAARRSNNDIEAKREEQL